MLLISSGFRIVRGVEKVKRESSGIEEVDKMLQGGFPKGSIIGLKGPAGVGKSIFSLHFLLAGARAGQKSVYICLEEPLSNIKKMIKQFSFSKEFFDYVEKGKIVIKCYSYDEYEKIYDDLFKKIKEEKSISRIVIDSFNCFFMAFYNGDFSGVNARRKISETLSRLRSESVVSMLVLEGSRDTELNSYIPFMLDGLIKLDFLDLGSVDRRIFIPKMRWTSQYKESKSYDISKDGIVVTNEETIV